MGLFHLGFVQLIESVGFYVSQNFGGSFQLLYSQFFFLHCIESSVFLEVQCITVRSFCTDFLRFSLSFSICFHLRCADWIVSIALSSSSAISIKPLQRISFPLLYFSVLAFPFFKKTAFRFLLLRIAIFPCVSMVFTFIAGSLVIIATLKSYNFSISIMLELVFLCGCLFLLSYSFFKIFF